MSEQQVTKGASPCIAYAAGSDAEAPSDAQLDAELQRDVDGVLNRISLLSGRARVHGNSRLMYALNRAWHEIHNAQQMGAKL